MIGVSLKNIFALFLFNFFNVIYNISYDLFKNFNLNLLFGSFFNFFISKMYIFFFNNYYTVLIKL